MPFRLWFYVTKVGVPVLFAVIAVTFPASSDSTLGMVRFVALCILVPLCVVGACMGIWGAFGKGLKMLCPFCGKSGWVGGSKRDGMWMQCETCGFVHGSGPRGLKIVAEDCESR